MYKYNCFINSININLKYEKLIEISLNICFHYFEFLIYCSSKLKILNIFLLNTNFKQFSVQSTELTLKVFLVYYKQILTIKIFY